MCPRSDYTGPNQFGIKKYFLLPLIISPVVSTVYSLYIYMYLVHSSHAMVGAVVDEEERLINKFRMSAESTPDGGTEH